MERNSEQVVYFEARSLSTGELVSGLTVLVSVVLDGGTPSESTNTPVEIGTTGRYKLTLTANETNANTVAVLLSPSTSGVFLPLITLDFETPADVSTLATASDLATLQTHGDANWSTATGFATASDLPTVPSAEEITASVWSQSFISQAFGSITTLQALSSASTGEAAVNAVHQTLGALIIPQTGEIAQSVWTYSQGIGRSLSSSPVQFPTVFEIASAVCDELLSDHTTSGSVADALSNVSTASALSTLQTSVNAIPTTTYSVPTVSEIQTGVWDEVPPILAQVVGLLGNWTVIGNTLTTYASDGTTVLKTYTLTRDADGEITRVTGATNA